MASASNNQFFSDFIKYLKYLETQPIKLTATGNISMSKISSLLDSLSERKVFEDHAKFGWKIRHEYEVETLEQTKLIAQIMRLTSKRKGHIKISKYGLDYLRNIDPLVQYLNMVLFYWSRVNWEYFSPSSELKGVSVVSILQKNHKIIWDVLSRQVNQWIDFKSFCGGLRDTFDLKKFYESGYRDEFSYYLDIKYGLFYRNLVRFGCVEIEEEKSDSHIEMISRFRVTPLGELMFLKSQETWI